MLSPKFFLSKCVNCINSFSIEHKNMTWHGNHITNNKRSRTVFEIVFKISSLNKDICYHKHLVANHTENGKHNLFRKNVKRNISLLVRLSCDPITITCYWIKDISDWTCRETDWKNKVDEVVRSEKVTQTFKCQVIGILGNFLQIKRGNENLIEKKI